MKTFYTVVEKILCASCGVDCDLRKVIVKPDALPAYKENICLKCLEELYELEENEETFLD